MPHDDEATQAADRDNLTELQRELAGPTGRRPLGFGGTVVAGPPDDALEHARMEIAAALSGSPTPGAMF
jgi:hypothetical protein